MLIFDIILIGLGLSMDACAVCVGIGASGLIKDSRRIFRLSFHFGLFQFLMPIIGWFLGQQLAVYISTCDHWIALFILTLIGIKMIRGGIRKCEEGHCLSKDPSKGISLIILSIATSIDALAVGVSFAMLGVNIWLPSIIIGLITAFMSSLGGVFGQKLGCCFGKKMEVAGGVILILIGVKIVIGHISI